MKVMLHLADGFEEIEAVSVVDVLRRADIDVKTVSIMGRKNVVGAHDIEVVADFLFASVDYSTVDMIILPGGGPGTKRLGEHDGLKEQLLLAAENDKWIAAICAAPTILGKLGILNGKEAMCYPGRESDLRGARVNTTDSVVIDGKIITSRGPGTSLDFALAIVRMLKGAEQEGNLRKSMIIQQ